MTTDGNLIASDIETYLARHERKGLLRFLTCGSVDDGKSTLIGRLLYDSKMIYEDQLAAIHRDSRVHGTTGDDFDPALLTDGLKAEREQGITIDVAYRYFSTTNRKFIIADTPGHEQYTRNMATGASNCDLAIILIDARHGVVTQTRRHSFIVSLLGIRHVIVAVNKMDLVDHSEQVYSDIQDEYMGFAARLEMEDIRFIPLSALRGDNVVDKSTRMPWYQGGTLLYLLDNIAIDSDRNLIDFRMPVQYVNRPNLDFRGYSGTVASGVVRPGDSVMALPSRKQSRVKSIVTYDGELTEAFPPLAVTLTLEDEIDVARGDVLVHPGNLPRVGRRFDAMLVWMSEGEMRPGARYLLKHGTKRVAAVVEALRYEIDVSTLHRRDGDRLELNGIGRCSLALAEPMAFDGYRGNRGTGSFILIDRLDNNTVGAGMIIDRALDEDRADHWDTTPASAALERTHGSVSIEERASRAGHRPVTVLLTGLSGSGKTTIAYALERRLFDGGHAVAVLDGESQRLGLNRDLGFSAEERSEALRRVAECASLLNENGVTCLCALSSPNEAARKRMAEIFGNDQFVVVHIDAPLEVCRERDTTGIYARAATGEIADVPGITAPYEAPADARLRLETDELSVEASVEQLMEMMRALGPLR
jgi:bifunctional enzyme CysN/CysC